ncbi:MAG: ABC transporter ATP-binding protein [Kiritimatiellia bacterium]
MLKAIEISKRFGRNDVLTDVSLTVAAGERVAVIGPHGAGKTTLLRILAGVWNPDDGHVLVSGYDLEEAPVAARQRIGYMPESAALPDDLCVGEYLRYRARLKGLMPRAVRPRIRDLLRRAGLSALESATAGRLSRGETRLVLLLDAVVNYPEVVILDEPFLGLDGDGAAQVLSLLAALPSGRAVVIAGHHASEVASLNARVVMLHEGCLMGPAAEVGAT